MKRKIFVAIVIVLVVIAAIGGIKFLQIRALIAGGKHFSPPPETVFPRSVSKFFELPYSARSVENDKTSSWLKALRIFWAVRSR